jgi:hypothetical protein
MRRADAVAEQIVVETDRLLKRKPKGMAGGPGREKS